jgi:hypothetical protein
MSPDDWQDATRGWLMVLAAAELLVGVAFVVTLLRAMWPGGRLFSIGAESAEEA